MADTFPTKEEYTNETLENDGFKATDPKRESTFQGKPKRGSKGFKGSKAMNPDRESNAA